ncbi:hypothetical protein G6F42_021219 [Rhizopus arrhizus]|nr:hypothetical protein G6F42_021219 [Rhizopus arrhizus]
MVNNAGRGDGGAAVAGRGHYQDNYNSGYNKRSNRNGINTATSSTVDMPQSSSSAMGNLGDSITGDGTPIKTEKIDNQQHGVSTNDDYDYIPSISGHQKDVDIWPRVGGGNILV